MQVHFGNLKDYVYKHISERVDIGDLRPGDKITESKLANELGLSRTPVREALIELAADGLLINEPRRGFKVATLTERSVKNSYEILGVVEGHIAASTCHLFSNDDFKHMDKIIDHIDKSILDLDLDSFYRGQNSFHEYLVSKCQNEELLEIAKRTRRLFLRRYFYTEMADDDINVLRKSNDGHRQIVSLMKEGDALCVRDYIQNVHWSADSAIFI